MALCQMHHPDEADALALKQAPQEGRPRASMALNQQARLRDAQLAQQRPRLLPECSFAGMLLLRDR